MRFTNPHLFKISAIVVALLAMTLFVGKPASTASAESAAGPMLDECLDCNTCFPSCSKVDGRLMSLSGPGNESFIGGTLEVGFSTPAAQPNITIGVFDPDSFGPPTAPGLWDTGTCNLLFEVYADPLGNGVAGAKLAQFKSTDAIVTAANNNWFDNVYDAIVLGVPQIGGRYNFVFRISLDGTPAAATINGFKLRTNQSISLRGQSIQFIAKGGFGAERNVLFNPPLMPSPDGGATPGECPGDNPNRTSTYDGTWDFKFNVPPGTTRLELWDGEMDFGSSTNGTTDHADLNTPNTGVCMQTLPPGGNPGDCAAIPTDLDRPDIPFWALGTSAVAEGPKGLGSPQDDNLSTWPQCIFVKQPAISYRLIPPTGPAFANNDPSGNNEWEKFLIAKDGTVPAADTDYHPAVIEDGTWKLRLEGVDISNQFTMHFTLTVVPPCETNIGDTVFKDIDGDGVQDAGDPGIEGVTLDLLAQTNCTGAYVKIADAITDASGNYLFANQPPGCYRVDVTDTGGKLTAFTKTSGPGSQADPYDLTTTSTPCAGNLTADFGYTEGTDFCEPECDTQNGPVGHLTTSFDANGNLDVKYDQALFVQDNSYGVNSIGWGGTRGFNALLGSDKAKFTFKDKNGVVVLSFFMDYLSTKTGTPSGYGSLGPDGGDGSMVTPAATTRAFLKEFNTSLARNLNDNNYCSAPSTCVFSGVDLESMSPPANSMFVVSNPAFINWKFVNSYEMKIDKAAFLAGGGFGSVEVTEIHNSPSKTSCNQIFPVPCIPVGQPPVCSIQSVEFKFGSNKIEWKLKNNGTTDIELTDIINFVFPAINGKLKKIKVDGDTIYDAPDLNSPVTLNEAGFKAGTDAKRTIKQGQEDKLIFEFEHDISKNTADYSGVIKFGTCEVIVP